MTNPRPGFADYRRAFESGARPSDVAEKTLGCIERSDQADPPLGGVLHMTSELARRDAEAADRRWSDGEPLSPLDGVPVALKDNVDIAGVPTSNGTVLEFPLPTADANIVATLRELGAVIVGKANLHEIGAGTTGINPSRGTARNPYDPRRWCGGSSSGSACLAGAALVPMTIGSDAGGSIRAPAAFCGVVGLKPTFGRISRIGMSIVCDTLDHLGPLTQSCADAAVAFSLLSRGDPMDDETWDQPPAPGPEEAIASIQQSAAGLRVGVARELLAHPLVEPAIASQVSEAIEALAASGTELVDVAVPDVQHCLDVGLLILAAEGPSGMEEILYANESRLGDDLRVLLRVGEKVTARDYMVAQRARQAIRHQWAALWDDCDAVVMPGPGRIAGVIRPDALRTGELDEEGSAKAIACTFPSNLTGYPAVCVPCGLVDGLPVATQIVAPPWHELRALRLAAVIESAQLMPTVRPQRYFGDAILAAVSGR